MILIKRRTIGILCLVLYAKLINKSRIDVRDESRHAYSRIKKAEAHQGETNDMQKKSTNIAAVAGIALVASVFAPTLALAVPMNITQTSDTGTNPASTITVAKEDGTVVKTINYSGGTATIDPVDVDAGTKYIVTAQANGYAFTKKAGTPSETGANVSITAKKAVSINVQLKGNGVTDYTGAVVKLVDKSNPGTPKSTTTAGSSGLVKIDGVPAGNYTIQVELPANLANSGIPTSQDVTVPENPQQDVSVTVGGSTQANGNCIINVTAKGYDGNPVSGAQFSVYQGSSVSGNSVASGTTGADGTVTINGLAAGTYTVRATTVPSGYSEPSRQTVTVSDGQPASASFEFPAGTVGGSESGNGQITQTGVSAPIVAIVAGAVAVIAAIAVVVKKKLTK